MSHPFLLVEHHRVSTSSNVQPSRSLLGYREDDDDELTASDCYEQPRTTTPLSRPEKSIKRGSLQTAVEEHFKPNNSILRREKSAIISLLFYLPFLLVPWILTAFLSFRPLNHASYIDHSLTLNPGDIQQLDTAMKAVRVLNSIGAILTVPVATSLLAQAVVVYTQDSVQNSRHLSFQQTLALANNSWSNALFWFEGLLSLELHRTRKQRAHPHVVGLGPRTAAVSGFLVAALALTLLVSVQQPLQQLLVASDTINVPTCLDAPRWHAQFGCPGGFSASGESTGPGNSRYLGLDAMPESFFNSTDDDIYIAYVAESLDSISLQDPQPNLWRESWSSANPSAQNYLQNTLWPYLSPGSLWELQQTPFYVTAFPNGTATGVLRSAVLRLNSSVACSNTSHSDFPSVCPGAQPFTALYSDESHMSVRVCVPGKYTSSPWSNLPLRSDITEELWLDMNIVRPWEVLQDDDLTSPVNTTIHCVVNSTMGYFILPNDYNGNTASGLLPSYIDLQNLMNSEIDTIFGGPDSPPETSPLFSDADENTLSDRSMQTPGPLTISALAMFGDSSWFSEAAQAVQNRTNSSLPSLEDWNLCQNLVRPLVNSGLLTSLRHPQLSNRCDPTNATGFMGWDSSSAEHVQFINTEVFNWVYGFSIDAGAAQAALRAAIFVSSVASLTKTTQAWGGEPIYASPGIVITRPHISTSGLIVISTLIGLQVIFLAALACYASYYPVWTSSLDALAMVRLGSKLETDQLPVPRPQARADLKPFEKLSSSIRFELSTTGGQIQPTLGEGLTLQDLRRVNMSRD